MGINIRDPLQREVACIKLIGKLPTLAAMSYRASRYLPFVQPIEGKSLSWNLLNMLFNDPMKSNNSHIPDLFVKALDIILLLHADHGQNPSTTTIRTVAS